MLKFASMMLALVVSLALVDSLSAQQRGGGRGGRGGGQMPTVFDRIGRIQGLNLTDDEKAKIADLKKEYATKLKDAGGLRDSVLTAEQKKAREDATKAATDAGKSRREVMQAGMDAVKLTDEQKAKLADGRKAMEALNKEITEKVTALLTPEQQDVLKKALAGRGNRGGGGRGNRTPPAN